MAGQAVRLVEQLAGLKCLGIGWQRVEWAAGLAGRCGGKCKCRLGRGLIGTLKCRIHIPAPHHREERTSRLVLELATQHRLRHRKASPLDYGMLDHISVPTQLDSSSTQ
jgi:hypothetical protein